MKTNDEEIKLLYAQLYGSIIFIISIIISTILTYNSILKQTEGKTIFKSKTENEITLINRIVLTILAIIFTYINFLFFKVGKEKNKDIVQKEELYASILALITAFILLSTTIKSIKTNTNNPDINTPII